MTDDYYSKIVKVLRKADKSTSRDLFNSLREDDEDCEDPPFEATLVDSCGVVDLWLGSASDAMFPAALKRANLEAIVNMASGQCADIQRIERIAGNGSQWERVEFDRSWYASHVHPGFKFLAIPAEDHPRYSIEKVFDTVYDFINEIIYTKADSGQRRVSILIHCVQGLNRSAAVCAAFLMRKRSMTALEAVESIASKRPGVLSNRAFVKRLIAFETTLQQPATLPDPPMPPRIFSIGNIVER